MGAGSFDLVTLDLNLPDGDGLTWPGIRARSEVPIIMVTGKGDTIDRVVGLELGADDYIAKPFHVREVLARVRTVLGAPARVGIEPATQCRCQGRAARRSWAGGSMLPSAS